MSLVLPINHLTEEYDFQVGSSYISMQNTIDMIFIHLHTEHYLYNFFVGPSYITMQNTFFSFLSINSFTFKGYFSVVFFFFRGLGFFLAKLLKQ